MQSILHSRYYNIGERKEGKYLVQTRSQAKSSGITLPAVHGIDKGVDPKVQPEKQVIKPIIASEAKGVTQNKPRLGQGRAGIKRKVKVQIFLQLSKPIQLTEQQILQHPQNTAQPKTSSDSRPQTKYIPVPQTRSGEQSIPKMISRDIPPYPDPICRPPPKPAEIPMQESLRKLTDLDVDINRDFEENSSYQEGIISET